MSDPHRRFETLFGVKPQIQARAHGRVNLIGEHTDYNEGFVLPTPIPQATSVYLSRRDDDEVRFTSLNFPPADESYLLGEEAQAKTWGDYVKGITKVLRSEGYQIAGFNLLVSSDIPMGSGLSSSAALEIALLRGLSELFGLRIGPMTMALEARRSENEFVGARVGIMDPLVISVGSFGTALFIDTRSLVFRPVALPLHDFDLLVIDSGVRHSIAHGGYNERRRECEAACEMLGIASLRDLDDVARLAGLPELLKRRARHVVTENARVTASLDALESGDFQLLGRLLKDSHRSLKDDYQVSVPEIDLLVELVCHQANVWGARLSGGGFGGSIIAVTRHGQAARVFQEIKNVYRQSTGQVPTLLVPGPAPASPTQSAFAIS